MAALERVAAPREQHPERIAYIKRLHLSTYSGTTRELKAELWLIEMENSLRAAQVSNVDKVDFSTI